MDTKVEKRIIANHIANIINGTAQFNRYNDNRDASFIHIMTFEDAIEYGINVYSTVGLSRYSIGLKTGDMPLRVEFIFANDKLQKQIPNMLATCAFCIINSHYQCFPGVIYYDIVKHFVKDSDMKHILFVPPFLWDEKYFGLQLEDKIVEWLLAIPISDAESRYAEKYGSEALEDLFEESNIDIFNIYRHSIL